MFQSAGLQGNLIHLINPPQFAQIEEDAVFLFSESISEAYSDYPKEVDIHLLGFDANHR